VAKKTYKSTAIRGIGKSRKGSPTIGLQTLIDRSQERRKLSAFFDEMWKLSDITSEKALEAAKRLSESPKERAIRHTEAGVIPAAMGPALSAVARGTKALVNAKKGRWSAARKAIRNTTKGDVAADTIRGGLFGAGLSVSREGLQLARARDTYEDFMKQHKRKPKAV
jgi:hypothetical protein